MIDDSLKRLGIIDSPGLCSDWDTVKIGDKPAGIKRYFGDDCVLLVEEVNHVVNFALLRYIMGNPQDGPIEAVYVIEMHGSGIGDCLREPRHTYFGEEGYISYVSPKRLAWAFDILAAWFNYE
jgi:hypothetical protein